MSAVASARSASPIAAPTASAALSGQPACRRVEEASAASTVVSAGSGSYSTRTSSSASAAREDRKSVVEGKRVDLGCRRIIKKKKNKRTHLQADDVQTANSSPDA